MAERIRVTFAASAVTDLEEIRASYAERQAPEVGNRGVAEIIERVESLQRHPDLGRVVPEFDTENLRELIHPPFRIVYRCDRSRVRVVRVWRSERLLKLPRQQI